MCRAREVPEVVSFHLGLDVSSRISLGGGGKKAF